METLNNKKTKKGIISRIIFGILLISSWAVLGLAIAVGSSKLGVGGKITFTATDVYADIDGVLKGTANDKSLTTISFDADTESPFTTPADWTNIDFSFGKGNYEVSITITIRNRSTERDIFVAFEDDIKADNLTVTRKYKKQNDANYTIVDSFDSMTIAKNTTNNPLMIQISMKVDDPNLSVKNGTFLLNIDLLPNEEIKNMSEYPTLEFSQNSDGKTMQVSSATDSEGNKLATGDLVIPGYVICDDSSKGTVGKLYKVTTIPSQGFRQAQGITSVYIPKTINSMVYSAFDACYNLTSVTFEEGSALTTIGESSFWRCSSLESIVIPDKVTKIATNAFIHCSNLKSVTIPDSVKIIGEHAFEDCTNLTSVTFKNQNCWIANSQVLNLSDTAQNATYLKSTYTDYTWTWQETAPSDSADYQNLTFTPIEGTTTVNVKANSSNKPSGDLIIPNKVLIDNTVCTITSIGSSAFSGCTELTSITIPKNVTSIERYAFYKCTELTSMIVNSENTTFHSAGNCIIETASKTLIAGCKASIIPTDGSVTSIGAFAFDGCSGLISITIPSSVTSIGKYAFSECSGLTSVTFENTSGWNTDGSPEAVGGDGGPIDVTNPQTNASNLRRYEENDGYTDFTWTRN